MGGKPITYQNFTVYPEYCGLSQEQLLKKSHLDSSYHVAAMPVQSYPEEEVQNVAVVAQKGLFVYQRSKYRLYESEKANTQEGVVKPEVVRLDQKNVLILICYEIVFPEDYLPIKEKVDLVVHLVGVPMSSEEQREGWIALQKILAIVYDCPVICCCGGRKGRMNLTGVIKAD